VEALARLFLPGFRERRGVGSSLSSARPQPGRVRVEILRGAAASCEGEPNPSTWNVAIVSVMRLGASAALHACPGGNVLPSAAAF